MAVYEEWEAVNKRWPRLNGGIYLHMSVIC
jgi:hypothetical protein